MHLEKLINRTLKGKILDKLIMNDLVANWPQNALKAAAALDKHLFQSSSYGTEHMFLDLFF